MTAPAMYNAGISQRYAQHAGTYAVGELKISKRSQGWGYRTESVEQYLAQLPASASYSCQLK